jgi:hypothetical protein
MTFLQIFDLNSCLYNQKPKMPFNRIILNEKIHFIKTDQTTFNRNILNDESISKTKLIK